MEKPSILLKLIKAHFSSTKCERSLEQLEREKFLLKPFLRFNRWFLIPAAVAIQFCCGSLYAWSVYNEPIEIYMYGQQTNTAAVTFYVAIGCLGISAACMGPWLERNGPAKTAYLGASGFCLANLLAALAVYTGQMWLLYVGYGLIGGCSIGVCYISPISPLQKFFVDRRGMASAFAVCGFGAGSIAASPLQLLLIGRVGVPLTFVILGLVYFLVSMLAAGVLRTPPPPPPPSPQLPVTTPMASTIDRPTTTAVDVAINVSDRHPPLIEWQLPEVLRSTDYWLMFGMFFGNVISGLAILSRLANMARNVYDRSAQDGSFIVAGNGALNLAGRLVFSILSDKIGRKIVFVVSLGTQLGILACMIPVMNAKPDTYAIFVALIWTLSAFYGCSFGVIPALLADMYGSSNIGACHGIILAGWSIAGVFGGLTFTAVFNAYLKSGYTVKDPEPYLVNFYWLLGIVSLIFISTLFIVTDGWHRYLIRQSRTPAFYIPFFNRLVRFKRHENCRRIEILNREQVIEECLRLAQDHTKNCVKISNGNGSDVIHRNSDVQNDSEHIDNGYTQITKL